MNRTDTAPANPAPDARVTALGVGSAIEPANNPAAVPAVPKPILIGLASEPRHEEPGGIAAEEGVV